MRGAWYFKHDYAAKADQKIIELEIEFGKHVGYSMWFRLLEAMGEAGGTMPKSKLKLYAITMQVEYDFLCQFIGYCIEIGLLTETDECYFNSRFVDDYCKIKNQSEKNSKNALSKWRSENKANAQANAQANSKATAKAKPVLKQPKSGQVDNMVELTPEQAAEIQRLRGYVAAIYSDFPNAKNKPKLSDDEYVKLIAKWGDKLVEMQRIYYEWLCTYDKKHAHTDFGTLIKGGWILEQLDNGQTNSHKKVEPSGVW